MKKIYQIFAILFTAFVAYSCSSDEVLSGEVGYLKLDIETVGIANPRSRIIEDYNPKQLAVKILDSNGDVVQSTDDHTLWAGKELRLSPGKYTVVASSNGFDGSESGFDIPYYVGTSDVITISAGTKSTASITCTLANVKVSVEFDETFSKAFTSAKAIVSSSIAGVASQVFTMGETTSSAYFPVGNITSTISVVNQAGVTHSSSYQVTNVEARDHYIFRYKTAETGTTGGITVTTDGAVTTYVFSFPVSMEPSTSLSMRDVNAWSRVAYLEGYISAIEAGKTLDTQYMKFEYKEASASEWASVAVAESGDNYTATLSGLTAATEYVARLTYNDGVNSYASAEKSFTTDVETVLHNGNMDIWTKIDNTWYCGEATSNNTLSLITKFWDSSNPGTTTGAGALVNANPTQGSSTEVHTAGGNSAMLKSQYASAFGIGKFAAASLYSGGFNALVGTNGAKINFGQPFTARPTQLKGWFKYSTGSIDYCGSDQPANTVAKGDTDLWSAYVVLTTGTYTLDNTDMSGTSKDFNALLNDDSDSFVVAYGALADSKCVAASDWTEFTVDLKYKNLVTKPTHIIIVFSSSKYGDYFTGSTSSLLYLDDLELVYGIPTTK